MIDLGIVRPGKTIRIPFSSFDKDDGSSITMTAYVAADILVYKDGSTTERASTAGFTATTDFDAKTGKHFAIIDLADNTTAGFFAAGSEYHVAIDAVTVDAVTTGGWIARFEIGYPNALFSTTIATLASQTSFTLTAGPAEDDALNNMEVIIHDVASAVQCGRAVILDYTGSTKTVTLAAGTTFTAAATDNISIMGPMPVQATTAGRTLDISATGEAGLDWANVGSPTTTLALTGTTISTTQKVDVETIKTNPVVNAGTVTFPTTATLASTTNITAGTIATATNVTTVNGLAANVITAASIAADAITDAKVASDVTIASVTGAVGSVTAGVTVTTNNDKTGYALTSAGVQAIWDALTSALTTAGSIGKFLVDNLSPLVSGTADAGGSTTTMIDAARTESATDHWKGQAIVFTSGTNLGLGALITAFDAATDTTTFTPAMPAAVGAGVTYQILPAAQAILAGLVHTGATVPTVTTLTGHTPQTGDSFARIGATGSGLTSLATQASVNTIDDFLDTEIASIISTLGTAGAGLTAVPWNAAWDAEVQSEVDDALNTAIAELGVAAPTATPTVRTALMLMYMALRNKLDVQTSGTDAIEIHNDAGTQICSKAITDDGTDYSEAKMT